MDERPAAPEPESILSKAEEPQVPRWSLFFLTFYLTGNTIKRKQIITQE